MKYALALVVAAFVITAVVYPQLPDKVPTHWNIRGEVDGYMPRLQGAFGLPLIMLVVAGIMAVLPHISPKGWDVDSSSRAFRAITLATVGFLFPIQLIVLSTALGYRVPVAIAMPLLLGLLFVVMGNYLGKVKRNFFIGIRTPWTLADDDVWYRTHRLGAKVFVAAGLLLMFAGPFVRSAGAMEALLLTTIVTAALIPVVYSYLTYRKDHQS